MSQDSGRRAQQRYNIEIPVQVTYQDRSFETHTVNISLGGMFLAVADPLPFGALVELQFHLPELATSVTVDAHVRWVQGQDGVGVQFAGLRAREVWALQKLFSSQG